MGVIARVGHALARWGGDPVAKAAKQLPAEQPTVEPKAWGFDPEMLAWHYASEVPSTAHPGTIGLDYGTLMSMSRSPMIGAIIQTRINQVAEFATPQPSPFSIGFRVRLRDLRAKPTRAGEAKAREIERVILRGGGQYQAGGFEGFVRRLVRDSLTYDQGNFEVIRTRGGMPWGMIAVDASTIRRAKPKPAAMARGRARPDDLAFIQIVREKVVREFAGADLGWCIRRPRTWVQINDYGFPELEELVTTITHLLNAETYNAVNFTTGIHSPVILTLKSAMDPTMFNAFKRNVVAMMSGVRNSKRTPIIKLDPREKEELQAVKLGQSNRDMEYASWINWLLKIACSLYAMDPAEMGFVFGNEGQTSSLSQRGPAERIWASKERGLRPLLRALQTWLTGHIVEPLDADFVLEFTGFDSLSQGERVELDVKSVHNWRTVNEVRAEHDLEPLDSPAADMILDPTYLQAAQMAAAEEGEEEVGPEETGEGMDLGEFTEQMGEGIEKALRSGRIRRDPRMRPGARWVSVPSRSGTRAWVVES